MDQMTDRLQTVIDAAEHAAEAIRFNAEEQARSHLIEAQRKADRLTAERVGLISELTDDLVRHAGTVRDHSEQMIRALDDAIDSVSTKLSRPDAGGSSTASPTPPGQAAFAGAQRRFASHPAPAGEAVSEDALVFATRLAVAGTDRATMATALRTRFGINDPEAVVARILGEPR